MFCPHCSAFVSRIGKFIAAHKRHEPRTKSWAYFGENGKPFRLEISKSQVDLSMKRPSKKRCNMCLRKAWKIEKYREGLTRKTSYARDICYLCHLKIKHIDAELERLDVQMASIKFDRNSTIGFDAFENIRKLRNLDEGDNISWAEMFPRGPYPEKRSRKTKGKKSKSPKEKVVIAIDDNEEEPEVEEPPAKKQKSKPEEIEDSEPFGFDKILTAPELPLEDVSSDESEISLSLKRKSPELPAKSTPPPLEKPKSVEITNGRFAHEIPIPVPIIKRKKKQHEKEEVPVHVVFSDETFKSEKIQTFVPDHYSRDNLQDAIQVIYKAMLPKPHRMTFQSIDECFRNFRMDLEKIELLVSISKSLEKFGTMGMVLLIEQLRLVATAFMEKELPRHLAHLEPRIWELRLNYPIYSFDRGNSISVSEMLEKIFKLIELTNRDAHETLLVMLFTL
jgi:hypothetical protein